MSGTKTAEKKADKKAQKKADKAPKPAAPVEVEPKGADVAVPAAPAVVTAGKRVKKNATTIQIDPSNVETGRAYLEEFYSQCEAHPPRKGYDQHWNSQGFIHSGPATRLPNAGAANMVTLIGDILAKREMGGDASAGAYLDYCIAFLQSHREALVVARENKILEAAAAIQAKKSAQ